MEKEQLICPKCQSDQLTSNNKGFNNTNAALGMLTGGIVQGMGYGMIGSGKIMITCLKCGHKYEPGNGAIKVTDIETGKETITYQTPEKGTKGNAGLAFVFFILLLIMIGFILDFLHFI